MERLSTVPVSSRIAGGRRSSSTRRRPGGISAGHGVGRLEVEAPGGDQAEQGLVWQ